MTNPISTDAALGAGDPRLVPLYTFEEFVVGTHNRFPHAASLAVSENLGKAYNPLFLYGPVGIGKTHLMQSVGHRVLQRDPKTRVLYVTAQQFMTEVIELLQAGRLQTLRERYRALDLLLVDDIQFLATSEATQEEFFHTFNDLHASGKQIIMTSDRPPKMLTTLEDRLRSRFEWGLIADIKFTNLETRVAILKKKESRMTGLHLADDIRLYIASRLKSNIRELEGFLRRIQAYSQLYTEEITLSLVKDILKELLPPEEWVAEGESSEKTSTGFQETEVSLEEKKFLSEMEGFDLQPSHFDTPQPTPPRPAIVSPPAKTVVETKTHDPISDFPDNQMERINTQSVPSPVERKEDFSSPKKISKTVSNEKPEPEDARPSPAEPAVPQPSAKPIKVDIPESSGSTRPIPLPKMTPFLPTSSPPTNPRMKEGTPSLPPTPSPILPLSPSGKSAPQPPLPIPSVLPQSLPPKSAPVSIPLPVNSGQIPVVFFYPAGRAKELLQMKKKFEDIINKHKLKFVLHPALEVEYSSHTGLGTETFLEKCQQAGVSIGVVLGPSPDTDLPEGIFFSRLQEAFDQAKLSLQMVPWDELSKDYRFLNLALDITLIRIKQKKT
jgi:Holliday junction resolvasome RuvABC ATP-dependent DNA helicase subunit